jgi:formamidopyrimidine-DNA glycosylase
VPELPEVETNASNLARWAVGRRVVAVEPPPGVRETGGVSRRAFVARLRGRRILAVRRRGKWILVALEGRAGLGLHLGMTGKIACVAPGAELPRFSRAVFELDDGRRVAFVDSRRFGRLLAVPRFAELESRKEIRQVGPDALSELTVAGLGAALAGTKRSVKEAIMDQRLVAGVGNLYATEALWRARIHPATPARRVAADARRLRALHVGILAALRQGLAVYQGVDVPEYLEEGAPNPFFAYDRVGLRCRRCRLSLVAALVIGGRTSAYCPTCQPAPG